VPDVSDSPELRRFFHDLATPLSGASLHLERATRLLERGEDASEALAMVRQQLERAFELFERGRAEFVR
jgi:exonuclease VII small subunit